MIKVLIATMKRNNRIVRRAYPWSFIFGRIVMGAYTAVFSYFVYNFLFKGNVDDKFITYTGSSDYLTYVILGASLHVFAASVLMNVGRSLMTELREGTLETLLLSPASRKGYFLGSLAEQIGRAILELTTILIIGWFLGANFSNLNLGQMMIVLLISLISFFSMSVLLASVMLYLRDTYISQNTLFIIMNFVCGVAFPIQYLPYWLRPVSHLFPLTGTLELFRDAMMNGHNVLQHFNTVIEVLLLSIIYLLIGFWWISKSEKSFVEEMFG